MGRASFFALARFLPFPEDAHSNLLWGRPTESRQLILCASRPEGKETRTNVGAGQGDSVVPERMAIVATFAAAEACGRGATAHLPLPRRKETAGHLRRKVTSGLSGRV